MPEPPAKRTGCFKLGCFGCAGIFLLTVLVLATLIGVGALVGAPDPRVEEQSIEQPLPPGPLSTGTGSTDSADPQLPPGGLIPAVEEPGRVVLDLSMGEFEIVAGNEPGPIRIDGDFDTAAFELVTDYERYGDNGWVYRIRLKRKIGWYRMMFGGEYRNFVRVVLPPEVPLSLEGRVGMGEVRMDLGGLWIVDMDLVASMGEFTVDFDRPLMAPMNEFRFESRMGEATLRDLGNASPAAVAVSHRMGELSLSLTGEWENDCEVRGGVGMGEMRVWVPDDVRVEIENVRQIIGASNVADRPRPDELDENAPTLRLNLQGGMGAIEVRRR